MLKRKFGMLLMPLLYVALCCAPAPARAAGAWTGPSSAQDYLNVADQSVHNHSAAMDASGNAVVAWTEDDGSSVSQVYVREYRNGVWTKPDSLADSISKGSTAASDPQVAMADNGYAVIIWSATVSGYEQIFMSEYRNGAWSTASQVSSNSAATTSAKLVMNASGKACIAWLQPYSTSKYVYARSYDGSSWGAQQVLSSGGSGYESPDLAMDASGNTDVVWTATDTYQRVYLSENSGGSWSAATAVSTDTSNASSPLVAMCGSRITVTWVQSDGTNDCLYRSVGATGASLGTQEIINPLGYDASDPALAMDADGNTIIAWLQRDSSGYNRVYETEYRNSAWTSATIFSLAGDGASELAVAMDNKGNALVVWSQYSSFYKSEYRNGAWTHPASSADSLNGSIIDDPHTVAAAMSDAGGALIAWQMQVAVNSANRNYYLYLSQYLAQSDSGGDGGSTSDVSALGPWGLPVLLLGLLGAYGIVCRRKGRSRG